MNRLNTLAVAMGTLGLLSLAGAAQAESLQHLDAQAVEVEGRTRDVCWELSRFHRAQPGYSATYRQAWELWSVSSHIHQLLHNAANMQRVQRNAADLRDLLAGIQSDVARWEAAGVICTFSLKKRLAGLDESIEHLAGDVGVPRPVMTGPPPAPAPPGSGSTPPTTLPSAAAGRNRSLSFAAGLGDPQAAIAPSFIR